MKPNPICGQKLVVENYGGGLRYHCPVCDVRQGEKLPMISWTNAKPPQPAVCRQDKVIGLDHQTGDVARLYFSVGLARGTEDFIDENGVPRVLVEALNAKLVELCNAPNAKLEGMQGL